MAASPKTACQKCGYGMFMPDGKGKVKGFLGAKGNRFICGLGSGNFGCHTVHIFDDKGHFLGFGDK